MGLVVEIEDHERVVAEGGGDARPERGSMVLVGHGHLPGGEVRAGGVPVEVQDRSDGLRLQEVNVGGDEGPVRGAAVGGDDAVDPEPAILVERDPDRGHVPRADRLHAREVVRSVAESPTLDAGVLGPRPVHPVQGPWKIASVVGSGRRFRRAVGRWDGPHDRRQGRRRRPPGHARWRRRGEHAQEEQRHRQTDRESDQPSSRRGLEEAPWPDISPSVGLPRSERQGTGRAPEPGSERAPPGPSEQRMVRPLRENSSICEERKEGGGEAAPHAGRIGASVPLRDIGRGFSVGVVSRVTFAVGPI